MRASVRSSPVFKVSASSESIPTPFVSKLALESPYGWPAALNPSDLSPAWPTYAVLDEAILFRIAVRAPLNLTTLFMASHFASNIR